MLFKFKIPLLLTTIFLILGFTNCKNPNQTNKHLTASSVDTNKEKNSKKDSSSDEDTIFKDENVIVLGNRSEPAESAIRYVAIRFKPHIYFSDFPANIADIQKRAAIQYSSNPLARQFKTVITKTYKDSTINFGGHYVFAEWGCGSPCQMSALVDVRTGIVYDGVDASYGYEFKRNSLMLITSPVGLSGFYLNCAGCEPLIYIWNERAKKFIQR